MSVVLFDKWGRFLEQRYHCRILLQIKRYCVKESALIEVRIGEDTLERNDMRLYQYKVRPSCEMKDVEDCVIKAFKEDAVLQLSNDTA